MNCLKPWKVIACEYIIFWVKERCALLPHSALISQPISEVQRLLGVQIPQLVLFGFPRKY